jgi:hypothetical protein
MMETIGVDFGFVGFDLHTNLLCTQVGVMMKLGSLG